MCCNKEKIVQAVFWKHRVRFLDCGSSPNFQYDNLWFVNRKNMYLSKLSKFIWHKIIVIFMEDENSWNKTRVQLKTSGWANFEVPSKSNVKSLNTFRIGRELGDRLHLGMLLNKFSVLIGSIFFFSDGLFSIGKLLLPDEMHNTDV